MMGERTREVGRSFQIRFLLNLDLNGEKPALENLRERASLADRTAIAKAPGQEWAWYGKRMEPKLVCFGHE